MSAHIYETHIAWEGSTGVGYDAYDRNHAASATGADAKLMLSSDPAFGGDASRLDPEQLLVLAVSSCQLLSFLAAAARARVDVVAYDDHAEGVMPEDDRPIRVTRIVLHPLITVRGDVSDDRLLHLVEVGHRECFIANSVNTEIAIEPEIRRV